MAADMAKKYNRLELSNEADADFFSITQVFLFDRKTKMIDLKREVCQFWELDLEDFEFFKGGDLALMRYEETVEKFFYSTVDTQRAVTELFLRAPDKTRRIKKRNQCEDRKAANLGEEKKEHEGPVKKKEEETKKVEVEKTYPGLGECVRDDKKPKEEPLNMDSKFYIFFLFLLLLIFTVVSYNLRNDTTSQISVDHILELNLGERFRKVTKETLQHFVNKAFPDFIENIRESTEPLLKFVGKVRLRVLNVKEIKCRRNVPGFTCHSRYHSSSSRGICWH